MSEAFQPETASADAHEPERVMIYASCCIVAMEPDDPYYEQPIDRDFLRGILVFDERMLEIALQLHLRGLEEGTKYFNDSADDKDQDDQEQRTRTVWLSVPVDYQPGVDYLDEIMGDEIPRYSVLIAPEP
jgi:hypothetical protein